MVYHNGLGCGSKCCQWMCKSCCPRPKPTGQVQAQLHPGLPGPHLFLISSATVRSIPFLFFIEPIFAWNVPLVSLIFLKRPLVFPILLFPSISLHRSLRKAFLSLLAILWNCIVHEIPQARILKWVAFPSSSGSSQPRD